jgi:nicotinate-nucleotide adenylyltransferase
MFLTLDEWHEPEVIFSLAEIACMRRESEETTDEELLRKAKVYRERFGAAIRFLQADAIELSSSLIRERIANGESTNGMLTDGVRAYLDEKGLYR